MDGIFLREGYLTSRRVGALWTKPESERFYFRLLLAVGDDGKIEADPVLLKSKCFPLVEGIRPMDISHWLVDCEHAGLVVFHKAQSGVTVEVLRHEPAQKARNYPDAEHLPDDSASVFPFAAFWDMYGKKTGRRKCAVKYSRIDEATRAKIKAKLPEYVASTPEIQYRKNPETWLTGHGWEDDLTGKTETEERKGGSYGRYRVVHG